MEKLGQLRASDAVGPDHRRHPAVAVGAGLPRRPEPDEPLPRRHDDPAAHRAGRAGGRAASSPAPASCSSAGSSARSSAASCCATSPRSSPRWTPCSAASGSGRRRPTSCCAGRARGSSSSRRRSPTRCGRPPTSSTGSRPRACRWPAWCSTAPTRRRRRCCRPPAPRAPPRRSPRPGGTGADLAAAALRVHAERMTQAAREQHLADRFTSAHPEVAVRTVPAAAGDVHDLDGLRVMGEALTGPDATRRPGRPRTQGPARAPRPDRGGRCAAGHVHWCAMSENALLPDPHRSPSSPRRSSSPARCWPDSLLPWVGGTRAGGPQLGVAARRPAGRADRRDAGRQQPRCWPPTAR